jgi:DNA helicase II / ATP-dependent DNA helicase PcrA
MTIHSTKGLEFDTVFIIDFHADLFNILPEENEDTTHRNVLYVAITRAQHNLTIFATGRVHPIYKDIEHYVETIGKCKLSFRHQIKKEKTF